MSESKAWLKRAHSSLALAKIHVSDDISLEDLCFHAQQAVEKGLKAVLSAQGVSIPRTHDLVLLLGSVSSNSAIPDAVKEAVGLNEYAVMTRYPGDYSPVSVSELSQAIITAETALDWCERVILLEHAR